MENLLTKNPDINVVYTINEPAAYGALPGAGGGRREKTSSLSRSTAAARASTTSRAGVIGATSQQYPVKMAELGVEAIAELAESGTTPETTEGLDFFDTGVELVTDTPADGVESIDSAAASDICWG